MRPGFGMESFTVPGDWFRAPMRLAQATRLHERSECRKLHNVVSAGETRRAHPTAHRGDYETTPEPMYLANHRVGNPASQWWKWRDRRIAQNVAKPRRVRPRMALTRRKKDGPERGGAEGKKDVM